ncbi:MAG: NADH/ubiquinone/plastoquinone (complex I) [Candidatus Omnitrophica bacterium]|nr:NADH/ubiquinone/plastoquinone (complex I) [Candidatus Omnitrophota bacterium]
MNILVLFVALPLLAAFVYPILGKLARRDFDEIAFAVTSFLGILSLLIVTNSSAFPIVYSLGSWKSPIGISWLLDSLSAFMLVVINVITFFIVLFSINYMNQYTSKWKYYSLLMIMLGGLNGVAITADLFNLYVFLEIAAIASYSLVAFGTKAEEIEASFKYMVLGSIASAFILIGIAFIYAKTSTLNMFDIANTLSLNGSANILLIVVCGLFIVGFGLKAALIPFHAWLPDAHPSAPAPISAMLSGLVIKVIGVYSLVRLIFNVFSFNLLVSPIILTLGILSMFLGVILAIGQWDFKRLLAYHSISQIGYIVVGLALGTPLGIAGGLFHLMNHSVFKSLLFLNAGSVEYATGTRDLKKLYGLQEKMPHTAWTSLVASLSIAGVPPFCGFWSKFIIILALFQSERFFLGWLAVISGIITLASFLKVQKYVFYRKSSAIPLVVKKVPLFMHSAMIGLAVLCIVLGLFFKPLMDNILMPAAKVLGNNSSYFSSLIGY